MAVNEVIERKNEILKRKIENLIIRQCKSELNSQDNKMMQRFIKEMHHNHYAMK